MKNLIHTVTLLTILLLQACSQPENDGQATDESIIRLMEVTDAHGLVDSLRTQMTNNLNHSFDEYEKSLNLTDTQMAKFNNLRQQLIDEYEVELAWEKMDDVFFEIYSSIYTQAEVDAQIAFYSSEVGLSIGRKNELLSEKIMQDSRDRTSRVLQKLQQAIKELSQNN